MKKRHKEVAPRGDRGTAKKLDHGKTPAFQGLASRFPRAMMAVADISLHGFQKYGSYDGWEKVPNGLARYSDAEMRHILKEAMGEKVDPDSGLMHAAHATWNALATLELKLREADSK